MCKVELEPRYWQTRKGDYTCPSCLREYGIEWRKRRLAAGLKVGGSKTWDPKKKEAWFKAYWANPANRARRAAYMRRYSKEPRLQERFHARWILSRAVKSGRIYRQPCVVCGRQPVDAHHPDYAKPLEVVWLCKPHHRIRHAKAKEALHDTE